MDIEFCYIFWRVIAILLYYLYVCKLQDCSSHAIVCDNFDRLLGIATMSCNMTPCKQKVQLRRVRLYSYMKIGSIFEVKLYTDSIPEK